MILKSFQIFKMNKQFTVEFIEECRERNVPRLWRMKSDEYRDRNMKNIYLIKREKRRRNLRSSRGTLLVNTYIHDTQQHTDELLKQTGSTKQF